VPLLAQIWCWDGDIESRNSDSESQLDKNNTKKNKHKCCLLALSSHETPACMRVPWTPHDGVPP